MENSKTAEVLTKTGRVQIRYRVKDEVSDWVLDGISEQKIVDLIDSGSESGTIMSGSNQGWWIIVGKKNESE